jgi:hypothetical protein
VREALHARRSKEYWRPEALPENVDAEIAVRHVDQETWSERVTEEGLLVRPHRELMTGSAIDEIENGFGQLLASALSNVCDAYKTGEFPGKSRWGGWGLTLQRAAL